MQYHKESAKQLEVKERETKKNNSPSPVSYKVEENIERTQLDRSNCYFKLSKGKKETFTDKIIHSAKKSPGVGQYHTEYAIDHKIARPMARPRAS